MKSRILSIIAIVIVVLGITNLTYAATNNSAVVTTLTGISAINKIEVHGNVELFVSDGNADQVKVYNKYYSENALVQSGNGLLRISSYTAEKLVVWVTAADLRSISAFDNSVVKSFGTLSKIEFSVDLHNNASAKLGLDAFNATLTVSDHSKADLSGTAENFDLIHYQASTVNKFNFTAANYKENKVGFATADKADDDVAGI